MEPPGATGWVVQAERFAAESVQLVGGGRG